MPDPIILSASAALIDLDGTLIDSNAAVEEHWLEFARWYDVDAGQVAHFHGQSHFNTIRQLLPGAPEQEIAHAVERFEKLEVEDTGSEVAMPGALELLGSLPQGAYTIVTACWRELAEARAKVVGIKLPDTMVTADQLTHGKPHPEGYLLAAERLERNANECVVFEDSVTGVTAAGAAGTQTVAVLTTTPVDRLRAANDQLHIVQDISSVTLVAAAPTLNFELRTV